MRAMRRVLHFTYMDFQDMEIGVLIGFPSERPHPSHRVIAD